MAARLVFVVRPDRVWLDDRSPARAVRLWLRRERIGYVELVANGLVVG
jgi:hypothetical protein